MICPICDKGMNRDGTCRCGYEAPSGHEVTDDGFFHAGDDTQHLPTDEERALARDRIAEARAAINAAIDDPDPVPFDDDERDWRHTIDIDTGGLL